MRREGDTEVWKRAPLRYELHRARGATPGHWAHTSQRALMLANPGAHESAIRTFDTFSVSSSCRKLEERWMSPDCRQDVSPCSWRHKLDFYELATYPGPGARLAPPSAKTRFALLRTHLRNVRTLVSNCTSESEPRSNELTLIEALLS